jgi:hypothetical protein
MAYIGAIVKWDNEPINRRAEEVLRRAEEVLTKKC